MRPACLLTVAGAALARVWIRDQRQTANDNALSK
ncbi:hypothetical protein Hoch_4005 [Haliangium ochraceum DSM 14365]|uniref:Uncharacterized protein n=1 Tax=Haliangium ochraceum (strain DSM 14365 / JCM 11303 / SMP-2) TaxID=502025 RepID=D0LIC5_HALO1|nr:hypothetical protein Hoch_4005 [Haliangium ochraceum DSM 14365]